MRIRKPTHSRNKARRVAPLAGVDYAALSRKAKFVGSPVHKSIHTWLGKPQLIPKANRSICPDHWRTKADQEKLQAELRKAIAQRQVCALRLGDFPKQVWCRIDGKVYEGFLVEQGEGTYKGYPLDEDELPPGL